jgi:hypothetical protein
VEKEEIERGGIEREIERERERERERDGTQPLSPTGLECSISGRSALALI